MIDNSRRVLPGFSLSLGYSLLYMSLLIFIPLTACFLKASSLSLEQFVTAVWTPRARAAYGLTIGASLVAAVVNVPLGVLIAWVLVRYPFRGSRILDAIIDLRFALPTAVAGLVYSSLYVQKGWLGRYLVPLGIQGSYSRLAIVLVLTFIGLPFLVRTVQPILQDLEAEVEEAAACLGATRLQTFWRVIIPALLPAIVTGLRSRSRAASVSTAR
jgi:sulfate transport system permease protein